MNFSVVWRLILAVVLGVAALNLGGVLDGTKTETPDVEKSLPNKEDIININGSQQEAIRKVDAKLAEGDRILSERRASNASRNAETDAWLNAPSRTHPSSTYTGRDNANIVR